MKQVCALTPTSNILKITNRSLSRWEDKLTQKDIVLLLQFRKLNLPKIEERVQILHPIASQAIVDGLIAYGWNHSELTTMRSKLMTNVKKHLDLEKLAQVDIYSPRAALLTQGAQCAQNPANFRGEMRANNYTSLANNRIDLNMIGKSAFCCPKL